MSNDDLLSLRRNKKYGDLLYFDFSYSFILLQKRIQIAFMIQSINRKELQIFEDISIFIQAFKRAISNSQLIFINNQRGGNYTSPLTSFCQSFGEIKSLSKHYANQNLIQIQSTTFCRFIYRLVEIITNFRIKYQYLSNPMQEIFLKFLKEMQAYIRECQKKKSFQSLINCTRIIFLKFVNKILLNSGAGSKVPGETQKISQMTKHLREELMILKQGDRQTNAKTILVINQQKERAEMNVIIQQNRQKIIIANRVLTDIQQRFDKFKGLDLDFSYFRGSYFESKSNNEGFYQNFMQRNCLITNAIAQYTEVFDNIAKRKQAKANRKIKTYKIPNMNQFQQQKIVESDFNQQRFQRSKGSTMMIPFNMNSTKTSGRLKNIYINLGKSNQFKLSKDKPSTSFLNKSLNQSNQKNNQSIISQSSNIFVVDLQENKSQQKRIKTEPGKSQRCENAKIIVSHRKIPKQIKVTDNMFTPKVQIKTNYLQLSCIPSVSSKQPKNQVFSSNKFSIRYADKSKLFNWHSQK